MDAHHLKDDESICIGEWRQPEARQHQRDLHRDLPRESDEVEPQ